MKLTNKLKKDKRNNTDSTNYNNNNTCHTSSGINKSSSRR